jgi:hypothetical protein
MDCIEFRDGYSEADDSRHIVGGGLMAIIRCPTLFRRQNGIQDDEFIDNVGGLDIFLRAPRCQVGVSHPRE